MKYNSFEPSANLKDYVKCYWTLYDEAQTAPLTQRILPDGCMEMIFHYGQHFVQIITEDNHVIQPLSFVFGQITKTLEIAPTGVTDIFSVRFHPGGFLPFAEFPLNEMENRAVPLTKLFGESGKVLEKQMLKLADTPLKIALIEEFLLNQLSKPQAADLLAKRSVDLIMEVKGQLDIGTLSEEMKLSRRGLERKFSKIIGLSPKELSRMVRMQSVLRSLFANNYENLTDIAYEFNYFDQAHFINDFKEFTGVSPKKFFSNNLKMASLFID